MLIKKELATVPLLPPRKKKGRILEAGLCELPRSGEILVVDFYNDGKLTARFFSDGIGYQTVFEWPAQTWHQAKPFHYYYHSHASKEETDKLVGYFLKEKYGEACYKICYFIERINREKRFKAEDAKWARAEQHMAMFPTLPEGFEQYCEEHIFPESFLFFTKQGKGGRRQGRCGSCGRSFRVKKDTKHNTRGACPRCGKPVTYKGDWYRQDLSQTRKICVAYRVDGQLLIRWVNVTRDFTYPECKRKYSFEDSALNLHLNTPKGQRLYGYVYQRGPYGYGKEWFIRGNEPCVAESFVYTENLYDVFGQIYYNVDLKAGLENQKNQISFHWLLNALRDSPVAEYLFKMGMVTLAQNYQRLRIELKEGEKPTFSKCLGVNGQYRQMYSKLDINVQEHLIIKASRQQVTEQDIVERGDQSDKGRSNTPREANRYYPYLLSLSTYLPVLLEMGFSSSKLEQLVKQFGLESWINLFDTNVTNAIISGKMHPLVFSMLQGTATQMAYVKLYDSTLPDHHPDNYYMEREWRSLLNIHFDLQNINRIYLPNADYKEKFEQEFPEYSGTFYLFE